MDIEQINVGSLLAYGTSWNLILFVIAICSVAAMTVFIERWLHLRRSEIDTNTLILSLRDSIRSGNIIEAMQTCEQMGGPVASILRAGLAKHDRDQAQIESAMEVRGLIEIANLEKNAKILQIIAHIAPLVGLLGTVLGFIQAFGEMRLSGLVDISASRIGEAMEYALVSTAAGLVVAIPAILAYNYLVTRIEGFVLEIQTTTAEISDLLVHQ